MPQIDCIAIIIPLTAALFAAVTDIWKFRVYNALTIPLFFSGLLYHGAHYGLEGLGTSALGALFGFSVLIIPYLVGLMGAGDVKLLAALGAWLGLSANVMVFVVSSLATGLYAFVLIVYRGRLGETWMTLKIILYRLMMMSLFLCREDLIEPLMADPERRFRIIPYAAMLPVGIIGALYWLHIYS